MSESINTSLENNEEEKMKRIRAASGKADRQIRAILGPDHPANAHYTPLPLTQKEIELYKKLEKSFDETNRQIEESRKNCPGLNREEINKPHNFNKRNRGND